MSPGMMAFDEEPRADHHLSLQSTQVDFAAVRPSRRGFNRRLAGERDAND